VWWTWEGSSSMLRHACCVSDASSFAHCGYPGGYYIAPVVPKWRNVGCHNSSQKITTHAFEWLCVLITPMRITMAKKVMRTCTAVK
jgi:hypothetical protein